MYKFIVDGVWKYDPCSPNMNDGFGNINNYLEIYEGRAESPSERSPLPKDTTMGSPGYSKSNSVPMPTAEEIFRTSSQSLNESSSYIGAGVLLEYTEEFKLPVDVSRQGAPQALVRSSSMSVLDAIISESTVPNWRRSASSNLNSYGWQGSQGGYSHASIPSRDRAVPDESECFQHSSGSMSARSSSKSGPKEEGSRLRSISGGSGLLLDSSLVGRAVGVPTPVLFSRVPLQDCPPPVLSLGIDPNSESSSAMTAAASTVSPSSSAASTTTGTLLSSSSSSSSSSPASSSFQTPLSHLQALLKVEGKLVVALCGLPARGKTFIARHLRRHLNWIGYRTEIFNVGNYRREILGAGQSHAFFDPKNSEGEKQRQAVARLALEAMRENLARDNLDVAIFDATNTTLERRQWLMSTITATLPTARLVFVESICNDQSAIRSNVVEAKLKSPDYADMEESAAVADFLARIEHYASVYQPVGEDSKEDEVPYIKLIDRGKTMVW